MQSLIKAMETLNISYSDSSMVQKASMIKAVDSENILTLEEPHVSYIDDLWHDSGIQQAFSRQCEYLLSDSAKYFLDDVLRLAKPDYIPTEQDILHCRVPTNGIDEYTQPKTLSEYRFRIIDVGSQCSNHQKWIHCFENVISVIFFASLSEYDQTLIDYDGRPKNRMNESIALFRQIASCPWFHNSSIFLFMNKKDLFAEKILHSHIADHFPEFDGPLHDEVARDFILRMFLDQKPDVERLIYSYFTCATDTHNILYTFMTVKDKILNPGGRYLY